MRESPESLRGRLAAVGDARTHQRVTDRHRRESSGGTGTARNRHLDTSKQRSSKTIHTKWC